MNELMYHCRYFMCTRIIVIIGTESFVYATKTKAETTRTRHLVFTCEMKTTRMIQGETLPDKLPNNTIKENFNMTDVNKFTRTRRN